jgi:putative phosphoesterase
VSPVGPCAPATSDSNGLLAALYDIHGNLPALDAALDEIAREEVERVVVGGDVLPGPFPRETIERLLQLEIPVTFIAGNGERVVRAQMAGIESPEVPEQHRDVIRWSAQQLTREHERLLDEWPETARLDVSGIGPVLFCHASPRNDTECFTRITPEDRLQPVFEGVDERLVVCGHTHMQFDRQVGRIRVVNAGSVGMPFSEPAGAYWLLIGRDIQFRRSVYDFAEAAERIRSTGCPQAEALFVRYVLQPPTETESLNMFAPVEVR